MNGFCRALITLMCLGIAQQMSGSQAVIQYAETIFDQANSNLEGKYLTMILGAVQLVCAGVCMIITDCSGRKSLLTISAIGAACSTAMVAVFFNLRSNHVDTSNITWLPATGVILYVVMYAFGLAALPFTMATELFPTNVKALGCTIGILMMHLTSFLVIKLYVVISENAGVHTPFWIFTASSLVSASFTLLYVPETKGRTLEQIQAKLHGSSKQKEPESGVPQPQHINLSTTNV